MSVTQHMRGRQIISANQALYHADRLLLRDDFGLTWGGVTLPSTEATTHFCVVGSTGSGKTKILRLLMQSCLPLIGAEHKEKSFVTTRSEKTEPTKQEYDEYDEAVATHRLQFAEREKALRENREQISAARERNASIRQAARKRADLENQLKKQIEDLVETQVSLLSTGIGMAIILALVYLSPELFAVARLGDLWWGQIGVQILFGLSFLWLFFGILIKLIASRNHNKEVQARRVALEAKIQLLMEQNVPTEQPEPQLLHLREMPPLPTRPQTEWSYITEQNEPNPYTGPGHRAIVYDAKGDIVSTLYGMGLKCAIHILNPFDTRSVAWDIAKDFTTPAGARQFATILVPEDKNASQPYFANSARDIITHLILALIQVKPEKWTLRDLILATQSRANVTGLLNKTAQGRAKVEAYFGDDHTGSSTLSEITTRMAPFESVAQAWSLAPTGISLTEWITSESILVLGTNEEHRAALDPINRVLFQRLTELTLGQSESDTRRTWFFLDEVRDAGNMEGLGRLMTKGRSKGACVVLGFQHIEGMHNAFGKERANELIGQCANKAVLHLDNAETEKWASELFGKCEFIEEESGENKGGSKTTGKTKTEGITEGDTTTTGTSEGTTKGTSFGVSRSSGFSSGETTNNGPNGTGSSQTGRQNGEQYSDQSSQQHSNQSSASLAKQKSMQSSTADNNSDTESWTTNINKKRMEKDAILASEFNIIPRPNPRNGLHGYYLLPSIGAFYGVLEGGFIKNSLLPPSPDEADYKPRPPSDQYLQEWTTTERRAMGLTNSPDSSDSARNTGKEDEPKSSDNKIDSVKGKKNRPVEPPRPSRFLPGTDLDNGLTRL